MILAPRKLKRLLIQACLVALPCTAQAATIDLLVLYDTDTQTYFNGSPNTGIRSMVDQVNTIYTNSQMDIQLRLVGTMLSNPAGANMSEVLGSITPDAAIARKRDELGADYVAQLHRLGSCGVAWVAVHPNYAFSVTGPKCGPTTLAHELGHNMGLMHSRRQGDTGGTRYPYALGHGVDGLFGTIMTYPWVYNGARGVSKFSNPRIDCGGQPCGVPEGQPLQADAAKAVNNVRLEMEAFRPTKATPPPQTVVTNGTYLVKAKHSGKCMDVTGALLENRSNIHQWSCHTGDNQRWTFTQNPEGYFEVKAKHSGKCMDVSLSEARNIHQWTCHKNFNQQWKAISNGDGTFRLQARHSGMITGVAGAGVQNGANILEGTWTGANDQRWTLERSN
ncbi:MAG: RICIN domain-containing protein [Pseudomonadota bacterium]